MTICIVSCLSSEIRGPQRFVLEFSKWLSSRSIKGVMLYGSAKTFVESIDINDNSTVILEEERSGLIKHFPRIVRSSLSSFLSFLKIIQLNKRYQFSIIHVHDANYGAMAAIASAKLTHVPVVLHVHGINMGVVNLLIRPKWLARLYRAYYLLLQRESIKRSDCVICVSEDTKKHLPTGKKTVIPMGVNTASFQVAQESADTREELRIPHQAFTLGYVGALSAGKGLFILLESFHQVLQEMPQEASMYLLVVGDGPDRKGLEDLAEELGIARRLMLTGFRNDVARLLGAIDVFVFPSESEGSPIAVLEAMAAGKAIIASDIPSVEEIVKHGKEAVLVNHRNVEELKLAILSLYGNPGFRKKLGKNAKERVTNYDVERVYGKILSVYKDVICH